MATGDGTRTPIDSVNPSTTGVTPLWASLVFTFLNSVGTGVVAAGLFFLAKQAYGFGEAQNFALGLLFGATYIPAALAVGPGLRRLQRRFPGVTHRRVLAAIMLTLGALCFLPAMVYDVVDGEPRGQWAVWLLMGASGPLNGALWPMIESYVSGGRSGATLRSAVGRFNVVWASALVAAFWGMAPLLEEHPLWVLTSQGTLHLACLAILPIFGRNPQKTLPEEHEPHPPVFNELLAVFRIQLPTSFIIISAIEPYLPTLVRQLDIPTVWHTPAAAAWLMARVITFAVMERWHGWHGRWGTPIIAAIMMIVGFVLAVLAPILATGGVGIALLVIGLVLVGAGVGAVYAASLYYALEVGRAEVDAGGVHEALIGLGYSIGPIGGLLALFMTQTKPCQLPFEGLFVGFVAVICGSTCLLAVVRAASRSTR